MKTIRIQSQQFSGTEWITRLSQGGYSVTAPAKEVLEYCSRNFVTTFIQGGFYDLAIIDGKQFSDSERTIKSIYERGSQYGYRVPSDDVGPTLRVSISDKEITALGFEELLVMHRPIEKFRKVCPALFAVGRGDDSDNGPVLSSYCSCWYDRGHTWPVNMGFVFVAPVASTALMEIQEGE